MHDNDARDEARDDVRARDGGPTDRLTDRPDTGRGRGDVRRQDGTSLTAGYIDRVRADARSEADDVFEAEAAAAD